MKSRQTSGSNRRNNTKSDGTRVIIALILLGFIVYCQVYSHLYGDSKGSVLLIVLMGLASIWLTYPLSKTNAEVPFSWKDFEPDTDPEDFIQRVKRFYRESRLARGLVYFTAVVLLAILAGLIYVGS